MAIETPNQSNGLELEQTDLQIGLLLFTSNPFIHNGRVHINGHEPQATIISDMHTTSHIISRAQSIWFWILRFSW